MVEQGEFGNEEHLPEAVLNYVNGLFGGEIVHSELVEMDGGACWKLEVINDAGSVVLFNITLDPIMLKMMEGIVGPFEYNIDPGEEFISFEKAREIAMMETMGELHWWIFKQLEFEDELVWIYAFEFIEGDKVHEVHVNALNGEILSIADNEHGNDHHPPMEVVNFVSALFGGDFIHSELIETDHGILWKIEVKNMEGAIVLIKISLEPLGIFIIQGIEGPFNYNIDPGDDFVSFADALEKAGTEASGELVEWVFAEREIEGGVMWVYEFIFKDGDIKHIVVVDASTGEIISVEVVD